MVDGLRGVTGIDGADMARARDEAAPAAAVPFNGAVVVAQLVKSLRLAVGGSAVVESLGWGPDVAVAVAVAVVVVATGKEAEFSGTTGSNREVSDDGAKLAASDSGERLLRLSLSFFLDLLGFDSDSRGFLVCIASRKEDLGASASAGGTASG